jgi:peptidoglycan/xylan/chitin deacetylase (PgdA/CDA1 family)
MAKSRWFWTALRRSGVPFLMRALLQRRTVAVLCYHDPDPDTLSDHLETLRACYNLVGLRDLVDARRSGRSCDLPDRSLVVTLDDGHRGNVGLLDVFRRYGVRPTIFLASGIVGTDRGYWWEHVPGGHAEAQRLAAVSDADRLDGLRSVGFCETADLRERSALSRAEIGVMSPSVDFQSHTVLHPVLSRCTGDRARTEIEQSKADLEREYGLDVYALSYPGGSAADWGDREAGLAARAGYVCALSAIPGANGARTDPFRSGRIVIPDDACRDELIVRASLLHKYLRILFPSTSR